MQMLYIWILAAVVFGVLEGITAQLVSIWFVLGAVAAAVAAACGGAVWLQGVLFVAVSVVALLATKPLVKKYLRPRIQATNAGDAVIKLKALEAFSKAADGQATKIIIPSEIQGLAGLAEGVVSAVQK